MPLYLHVATPTACLQSSIPAYLHVATPTARLRGSTAPCLQRYGGHTSSQPPELHAFHTSVSPHLQCASRPPHVRIATSTTRPETPRPPSRYACSASPGFQSSILPCLHVATPSMHLQG